MSNESPRSPIPPSEQRGTPQQSGSLARAEVLRDVLQHAAREQQALLAAHPVRRSRLARAVAVWFCVPALAFSAWSLIAQPAFLWGPPPAPLPGPRADANARMVLYLLAQRLEAYRAEEGDFPASLSVLGQETEGVVYAAIGDTGWVLRGRERGREIVLHAGEDLDAFLGPSLRVLRGER
jgi:hypothetical protein